MDAPLLALTRRRLQPAGVEPGPDADTDNMRQLIQLRWIAILGQVLTILTVAYGLHVPLPVVPMLGVVAVSALVNLASAPLANRRRISAPEMLVAVLFDVGALSFQLYLSGGATNPFVWLFLLQVVLGAILLGRPTIWLIVALTSLSYAFLTRYHLPLDFPPDLLREEGGLYTLGNWLCFGLISMLLVLFVTRIIRNLRVRDARLADLRQEAAEQDHLVRMGLFASGAAHELGTPLATLSVILGDWRRMPRLATDAELAGEIAEMQAEVQRCKAIVTDVLHSVAEMPDSPPERVGLRTFLSDVVALWCELHPAVQLSFQSGASDASAIFADPALRQAIWNVLDNAAEVSPDEIDVDARLAGQMLTLAVRDTGPGFSPALLTEFGKPRQSAKGAGHGVGLFLVASVVRKLGGTVTAANRSNGGAEVILSLPLQNM